jgi:acetyl esterase/lipase
MTMRPWIAALATIMLLTTRASAQPFEVVTRPDVEYVVHDGVKLTGDLYLPKGRDKAPVLVAVHGGGWQAASPVIYRHWGPYLAKHGYAVFAVRYRLNKPEARTWPGMVYDVKAAVQFVRAKAGELGLDPERIGLMGDSAGAHLASMVALAATEPMFSSQYGNDPNADTSAAVKAVVAVYGAFDLLAQWHHDQIARPRDQLTEKLLGASPAQNRRAFFDASPLSYATVDKNRVRFLLVHGTHDDIADPLKQSQVFLTALKQAGFFVRTIVIPGAGHFFWADPVEEPGSYNAQAAPQVLRFLEGAL